MSEVHSTGNDRVIIVVGGEGYQAGLVRQLIAQGKLSGYTCVAMSEEDALRLQYGGIPIPKGEALEKEFAKYLSNAPHHPMGKVPQFKGADFNVRRKKELRFNNSKNPNRGRW